MSARCPEVSTHGDPCRRKAGHRGWHRDVVNRQRWSHRAPAVALPFRFGVDEAHSITDGYVTQWCNRGLPTGPCGLQVVRPGKTQCDVCEPAP